MKNESEKQQENLLSSSLDPFNESCPLADAADVLCGRGRTSFNHVGNKRFRERINATIKNYIDAPNRYEKSLVVHGVVEQIQASGGRFLKHDEKTGSWYELSSAQMKEKVGHAIRDAVNALEARAERKRMSDTKEEREPGATSLPLPHRFATRNRPRATEATTRSIPNSTFTNKVVHKRPHLILLNRCCFINSALRIISGPTPSFHFLPATLSSCESTRKVPASSPLHDASYFDQHHPNVIEPIPYPPPVTTESTKTGDLHRVAPSDAGTAADIGHSPGEEDDHVSQHERDPFLDQINQVLGPIVDEAEDCISV